MMMMTVSRCVPPSPGPYPQVLRVFVNQGVHRLAVVEVSPGSRRLVGVITQSAVLRFVRKHMDMLAPVADVSMSQFLTGAQHSSQVSRERSRGSSGAQASLLHL